MKPLPQLLSTLTMSAAAIFAGNAIAVETNSSLNNYGYRLIDLDPNDGVVPTITFTSAFSETFARFCSCGGGEGEAGNFAFTFPSAISAGGTDQSGNLAFSSISSDAYLSSVKSTKAGTQLSVTTFTTADFTLSSNTQLVFYGTANINKTGYIGEQAEFGGSTSASISQFGSSLSFFRHSIDGKAVDILAPYSEYFEISYSNSSAKNFSGTLDINANSSLIVTSVPEPSTYMMLLTGMAVLGGSLRRRTRRN